MGLLVVQDAANKTEPIYNFGVESLKSHEYSVGIFVFMMIGIALFVGIMAIYMRPGQENPMKKGEWYMMGAILLGVIAASILAALQMLEGYLF